MKTELPADVKQEIEWARRDAEVISWLDQNVSRIPLYDGSTLLICHCPGEQPIPTTIRSLVMTSMKAHPGQSLSQSISDMLKLVR